MAVVTPLEDLLESKLVNVYQYHRLKREVNRYLPLRDAKHIAWHITLPQHIFKDSVNRKASLFPQYDTLTCRHCQTAFSIPMLYPRFHETTQKAFRSVHYKPNPPQECPCGNLKTLTDAQGNLRVYLLDPLDESFDLHNGPVNLRIAEAYSKESFDIAELFDTSRPKATDPFSFEVRNRLRVNHINLFRTKPIVAQMLLPYESFQNYARLYNIVIFGSDKVYFPTGHIYSIKEFDFKSKLEILGNQTPNELLYKVTLDQETAEYLNTFSEYLYREILPTILLRNFNQLADNLANSLGILRTYHKNIPIVPILKRLEYQVSIDKKLKQFSSPLSLYAELSIMRLPQFTKRESAKPIHRQDFKPHWIASLANTNNHYAVNRKDVLIKLKQDRKKLLRYTLPRLTATPESIQQYAQHALTHIQLPPLTPPNQIILDITTPHP